MKPLSPGIVILRQLTDYSAMKFRDATDGDLPALVGMVQLTTDKSRPEALAFYEKLGFVHSHAGMKLKF